MDDILKFGAKELFDEEDAAKAARASGSAPFQSKNTIVWDGPAIERLLDRSQAADGAEAAEDGDEDFLKAFKVADFEVRFNSKQLWLIYIFFNS